MSLAKTRLDERGAVVHKRHCGQPRGQEPVPIQAIFVAEQGRWPHDDCPGKRFAHGLLASGLGCEDRRWPVEVSCDV